MLRGASGQIKEGIKEIVISYKTIFVNTYNVLVMDICYDERQSIVFKFDSF